MRSLIPIALALFFFSSIAALFAAGHYGIVLPWSITTEKAETSEASPSKASETSEPKGMAAVDGGVVDALEQAIGPAAPSKEPADNDNIARLDISRISESGASVFAGRAQPNTYVTVLADGVPIGTAKADENGDWSLATEHKFASLEPTLSFTTSNEAPAPAVVAANSAKPKAQGGSAAGEVLDKFEKMVEEAREDAAREKAAASAETTTSPQQPSASTEVGAASNNLGRPGGSSSPGAEEVTIPVPIMFDYDAATLTSEGERAARLLLEYVTLKRLSRVALSGHADERGSDAYNVDLSRERLDAVAKILRDGGYTGSLDLVPRGKSEPYSGVDRTKFSGEALYQLDRRVELRFLR